MFSVSRVWIKTNFPALYVIIEREQIFVRVGLETKRESKINLSDYLVHFK